MHGMEGKEAKASMWAVAVSDYDDDDEDFMDWLEIGSDERGERGIHSDRRSSLTTSGHFDETLDMSG